jgi:hypothetical protein
MIHRMLVKMKKVAGAADEDVTGDVTPARVAMTTRHAAHIALAYMRYVHGRRAARRRGKGSTFSAFPPGKHSGFAFC